MGELDTPTKPLKPYKPKDPDGWNFPRPREVQPLFSNVALDSGHAMTSLDDFARFRDRNPGRTWPPKLWPKTGEAPVRVFLEVGFAIFSGVRLVSL